MRRFLHSGLLTGVFLAVLAAGCSERSDRIEAPKGVGSSAPAPLLAQAPGAQNVTDSYIVVLKESVADVDHAVSDLTLRLSVKPDFTYRHALKGFSATLTPLALDALRMDPRVAYIERNQIAHIVTTQTNATWGLDRVDQRALPLSTTYTYNGNGAGVDVYVLDTGIRKTHVDFGGRAVTGYDAITSGGTANDGNGHGTHVAGTIGGNTYGIAKGVRLIAVRVLDNSGSGTYAQVIAGVDWVTSDHTTNPAAANMSLGGPVSTSLDSAVRNSIADGITYCVAAGNSGVNANTQSPADVAEAITVGATDATDAFASWSNYGSILDLSAPGVSITSDWNSSDTATNTISGTSMATPHVTGSAALYLEVNPSALPAAVSTGLTSNATSGVIRNLPSGTPNLLLYSVVGAPPSGPPSAPALLSPGNGAIGVSIPATLTWSASSGAASYELQVSTSSSFTTTVYDQAGITSTSASVSGLSSSTVYYWRVNATNSYGTSGWSSVWSFTTAAPAPPPAPVLLSPTNGAQRVSRSPTLSWNASTGATSYRVQVSRNTSFTNLVYDVSGITSTSTQVTGLGSRTRYYWHVNASNSNGTSGWSSRWNFTTNR